MKGKVLIAAPVHPVLTDGLLSAGYELVICESINQEEGLRLVCDCVGIITSTRLQINRELIDKGPFLQFVGRMGSGMEVIDLPYAETKGIRCVSSPEGNANAVAEHALGMLLAVQKRIAKSFSEIRLHAGWQRDANRGEELEGKTIGIIGFGHTGQAFARLLRGFDVRILVYDKYVAVAPSPFYHVCTGMSEIQEQADIISLHVPFSPENCHMVDKGFVEAVCRPFTLINTSRGMVVDSTALPVYLHMGKIKALCLDVWEEEPLEKMSSELRSILLELAEKPNVILTPHIAGYSHESLYKMSRILLDRITI